MIFNIVFLIALVLFGATSPECQRNVQIPITTGMLQSMFHTAPHVAGSPYAAVLTQAILTLGFFELFQPGELIWSPYTIQFWDVKVTPQAAFIILRSAKCQKVGLPCKITLLAHPYVICPIKALMKYLAFHPQVDGPLFVHQDGRPVTRWELANSLNKLSTFLQFPKQLIKPHSLCIGTLQCCTCRG